MPIPSDESNRAIITVIGHDQIGIIAWAATRLADCQVNILDISQTILNEFFTMIMVVDMTHASPELVELAKTLEQEGLERGLQVKVQHEDIFTFMHRI